MESIHREYQKLFILCPSFLVIAKRLSNQALKSGEIQDYTKMTRITV